MICYGCVFGHSLQRTCGKCDGVSGHGRLCEECGEVIPVMGAFCGPLGRVCVGDARPGNIDELVDLVTELCQTYTPLIHCEGGPGPS